LCSSQPIDDRFALWVDGMTRKRGRRSTRRDIEDLIETIRQVRIE
jgi:hypothetical protein